MADPRFALIRLEVEGMKHSMVTALTEHHALISSEIVEAVERYCTKENIESVVRAAAHKALDSALREEVENFFRWPGKGREVVAAAVRAKLIADLAE